MEKRTNRKWILKTRPKGMFELTDFEKQAVILPELEENQVLLKSLYLSFDPTQRTWAAFDTYMPAVPLGEVMRAFGLGQVIESKNKKFKVGDIVGGLIGWQEYVIFNVHEKSLMDFFIIPPYLKLDLSLALMITGLTAYFGMFEIGKPKLGETVVVSGAAGATGSIAGQLAKIAGAHVIGIAGGTKKCQWLIQKGHFDDVIDYKTENIEKRLGELCPNGVDVFFDNVGGGTLDAVILHIAQGARIVLCGQISEYNKFDSSDSRQITSEKLYGVKSLGRLILSRALMKGFIVTDFRSRNVEGFSLLNRWTEENRIEQAIDMREGFDQIPETMLRIFEGKNLGKQLLKLSDPPFPLRRQFLGHLIFKMLGAYYAWKRGFALT